MPAAATGRPVVLSSSTQVQHCHLAAATARRRPARCAPRPGTVLVSTRAPKDGGVAIETALAGLPQKLCSLWSLQRRAERCCHARTPSGRGREVRRRPGTAAAATIRRWLTVSQRWSSLQPPYRHAGRCSRARCGPTRVQRARRRTPSSCSGGGRDSRPPVGLPQHWPSQLPPALRAKAWPSVRCGLSRPPRAQSRAGTAAGTAIKRCHCCPTASATLLPPTQRAEGGACACCGPLACATR
jgi:hypothetical protein